MAFNQESAARSCAVCDKGQTLVETALSLTLILTLILGIVQMSLALYTFHYTSHVAREASRYAIVRGSASCSTLTTPCNVNSAAIQSYVRGLAYPIITPGSVSVTATWPSTTLCTPSATPCNNPGNLVQVVVSYPFNPILPFFPVGTINMTSTSEMVISQ